MQKFDRLSTRCPLVHFLPFIFISRSSRFLTMDPSIIKIDAFIKAFWESTLPGVVVKSTNTETEMLLEPLTAKITFTVSKTDENKILDFCNSHALEGVKTLDEMRLDNWVEPVFVPLAKHLGISDANVDPDMAAVENTLSPLDQLRRFGGRLIVNLTYLPLDTIYYSGSDSDTDSLGTPPVDSSEKWVDGYLDLSLVLPGKYEPTNNSIGPCDDITFTLQIQHYRPSTLTPVIADVFTPEKGGSFTVRPYTCNGLLPQPAMEESARHLESVLA